MQRNRTVTNPYSRTKSGKREDLDGMFFRSSWEANWARYLNLLKKSGNIYKWEYEADNFEFPIKRGTRSYTPDFKIWDSEESEPYYHEVKGWMDSKSKTRLNRMAKYHPDTKIIVIGEKQYKAVARKCRYLIKTWE